MKSEIKGIKAAGERVEADLLFLGKGEIRAELLEKGIAGKIIVGGKFGRTALMKALTLDAAGVVMAEISDELFEEINKGKDWQIGEACSFKLSLLVIEELLISELADLAGKKVVLNPPEKKLYVT